MIDKVIAEFKTQETIKNALCAFGAEKQTQVCIEECAELIVALNHFQRGKTNVQAVITEIADVIIMCLQMAERFGEEQVADEMVYKLDRLQRKINNR